MNRKQALLLAVAILALVEAWHIYAEWGLVTIDVTNAPLATVMHSIERQAWVNLATNMPGDTKVTMHIKKYPLPDALEALSIVTESRWRLTYVFAPIRARSSECSAPFPGTRRRRVEVGLLPALPAGHGGRICPHPGPAARHVDRQGARRKDAPGLSGPRRPERLRQLCLSGILESGRHRQALHRSSPRPRSQARQPRSCQGTGGFPLHEADSPRRRDCGGEGGGDDERMEGRFRGGGGDGLFARNGREGREGMEARALAEIEKLPPAQQAAARTQFNERKAFFQSLRDLPPDQRQAKIEEMMNQASVQAQQQAQQNQRDSQQTPEQREDRAENYMNRAASVRSSMSSK